MGTFIWFSIWHNSNTFSIYHCHSRRTCFAYISKIFYFYYFQNSFRKVIKIRFQIWAQLESNITFIFAYIFVGLWTLGPYQLSASVHVRTFTVWTWSSIRWARVSEALELIICHFTAVSKGYIWTVCCKSIVSYKNTIGLTIASNFFYNEIVYK